MTRTLAAALLSASAVTAFATPVHAQEISADEAAQLRAQLAAMKAQLATLEARVAATDQTAQDAGQAAANADVKAQAATAAATEATAAAKSVPAIAWKGAPEITGEGGWSFKPRGRAQLDIASVNAPDSVGGNRLGTATEFRRIYLGVDGKIPGGFAYRVEADLANSAVELTDVYVTYSDGPASITVGQIKPFWSLEEMTSDLFTSFMERASFTSGFGFERRVGVSGAYNGKSLLVQGGVFSDNASDLLSDSNNSYSFDGRVVYFPKLGNTQLHLGGSAHYHDFNDGQSSVRYRARPFAHTTDLRLIDTGNIAAKGERGLGLEAAAMTGPFHASAEGFWQTALVSGAADPTFFGGYGEVGMMLTPGDSSGYKGGAFDRIKPSRLITKGGIGAIQLNARYDYLDLVDNGITGGTQNAYGLSLVWVPIDYVRFVANYGHIVYDNAAVPAGTDRSYSVDTLGMRAQIDF
ncbi:porin [Sphingorhabdus soli]|uniref:Porin n=1 Tax=Flavisphingopyxis soli TaxID=2601267 RepID=A0A5C6UNG1_9SPHN|nr:porin [Sphingorhabdus soli]TXC74104.1 porin [Sphingorhabdus soli]